MTKLKRMRTALNMTQAQVAEHLTIGQAEYARIEKGTRQIGTHAPALAKIFKVDLADIYENDPKPQTSEQVDCEFYAFPTPDGEGIYAQAMQSRCPLPPYDKAVGEWKACICPMDLTKLKRGDLLYFDTGIETKIDDTVVCLMDNDIFRIGRWAGDNFYVQNQDEIDFGDGVLARYKVMLYTRRFT